MAKIRVEQEKIIIEDKAKSQFKMINFLIGINLFNSIIFISGSDKPISYWLNILWIVVGLMSVIGIIFQLKKTTMNELQQSDVVSIRTKRYLNINKLLIKLNNGKSRDVLFASERELFDAIENLRNENYEIL